MPGTSPLFGTIRVEWTENPPAGETFLDNELNPQLGKWTLVELPPNILAVAQVISIEIVDPGEPTSHAVFTGEVAALGATGPKSGVTIVS